LEKKLEELKNKDLLQLSAEFSREIILPADSRESPMISNAVSSIVMSSEGLKD
jgi:hypothetical protein